MWGHYGCTGDARLGGSFLNICMAGIDFHSASLAQREPVSFVAGQVEQLLPKIRETEGVLGCVLIATCNRTELYLHTQNSEIDPLAILTRAAGVSFGDYQEIARVRRDDSAVTHLFEVAAGMQSQIFGDNQIVSQVRDAIALARKLHCADSVLDTLFRCAVTGSKRVKTETRLIGVPASAAHRGVARAQEILGVLRGKRAVVIGNGEMGRLAASLLYVAGCEVTITLRSYRHGETVVPAGCATYPYDERCKIIDGADLVVSATTSPHYTLSREQVQSLKNPPALLVDLAMPRDIEDMKDVSIRVLNLDDLGTLEDENAAERAAAHTILGEEKAEFYAWYEYRKALPLIAQMKDTALVRVRHDRSFSALYTENDVDELIELAVHKTVDMLLGGMKEGLTAAQMRSCLDKMQKGTTK